MCTHPGAKIPEEGEVEEEREINLLKLDVQSVI